MMKIYFLNYADDRFKNKKGQFRKNQKKLNKSARKQGFKNIIARNFKDLIKTDFYNENKKILDQPKGAGYWLWKPYFILELLKKIEPGDIVLYYDCGSYKIKKPIQRKLVNMCNKNKGMILPLWGEINSIFVKRDAFVYMNCDNPKYHNAPHLMAGWMIFQKTTFNLKFVEEWLKYCKDERIVTDMPNTCGLPNLGDFYEHRGDQSVLTNLSVKYGIKPSFGAGGGWYNVDINNFFDHYNYKLKILLIADYPNWAYDYKAKSIVKHLSNKYSFDIIYTEKDPKLKINHEKYDGIYLFYWDWRNKLKEWGIPKSKLGSGITHHINFHKPSFSKNKIKNILSRYDVFSANSLQMYKLLKKYRKDIIYAPNGVDTDLFKPNKGHKFEKFTIGWVGNSSVEKKHFFDIIVPAVNQCENVRLITATKEQYISREKMPEFYNKCNCLVVASEMDGTPNPALEAAACGKPIISNKIGNMPELIQNGKNGFLVKLNIKDYIKRITFLRDNPEICEKMGKRIREDIKKGWGWEKMAKNYDKLFEKIVD